MTMSENEENVYYAFAMKLALEAAQVMIQHFLLFPENLIRFQGKIS